MILAEIGLSTSEAITMFLKAVVRERGVPFGLKIADDTSKSFKEVKYSKTRDIKKLIKEFK